MSPYRIVVADDHALFRQGLKKIIHGVGDLEIVGEAGDGLALIELLKKVKAQMVILDISMPNIRGIEATCEIKKTRPDVKALILTMHKDPAIVNQAFSALADGYLLKEAADSELFTAIDSIRRGRRYLSPDLVMLMSGEVAQAARANRSAGSEREPLTTREREVLKMMAEGKTSKEMADLLFISARTVGHHRANIMNKLRLKKTADLIRYALHKGYA